MAQEHYTIKEAYLLLGVDEKTLKAWMKKAGIESTKSDIDFRIRYVAHADLERIAVRHGRRIGERSKLPGKKEAGSVRKLREEIASLRTEVEKLRSEKPKPAPPAPAYSLDDYLNGSGYSQPRSLKSASHRNRYTREEEERLPDGLISVPEFSRKHNIPYETIRTAIKDGRLHVVPGRWKVGRHWIDYALDTSGCREVIRRWGITTQGFQTCELCPHEDAITPEELNAEM